MKIVNCGKCEAPIYHEYEANNRLYDHIGAKAKMRLGRYICLICAKEPEIKEISLAKAIAWGKERNIVDENISFNVAWNATAYGVAFDDGSQIGSTSNYSGPYSEVTPDIDKEPPTTYLWVPGDRE